MKILFATGIYPPDIGGPASYVSRLTADLPRRGIDVSVVTYGAGPTESRFRVRRVSRKLPLPARYGRYLFAVSHEARECDAVYLQDPLSSGAPGSLGARIARKPVLLKIVGDAAWEVCVELGWVSDDFLTFQRTVYSRKVELVRGVQRLVARRADGVIVPSRFLRGVVAGWGIPESRIRVVPNSLPDAKEPSLDREEAKRLLGLSGQTILFSATRLVPWKGVDTLVELAAELRHELPRARWLIAGTGPLESRLRSRIEDTGAGSVLQLVGGLSREEMARYLSATDLFVLWSGYEGLSHVLLEAMRAGRAVVASDAGGNPEIIESGRNGILVPWQDTAELRRTLVALTCDPSQRARLEREAALSSARFNWDDMVRGTLDALNQLVESRC